MDLIESKNENLIYVTWLLTVEVMFLPTKERVEKVEMKR